jgi:hypothetical protein
MNLNEWVNNYVKEVTHSHEYEDMSQMRQDDPYWKDYEISEDEKDPQEITVGNYQTKYFHVCPGASTLYKDIESKGVDMDMAERSARLQDALYFVEEHIQRDGYEPDKDYVMVANNIAKNIMKMAKLMGLEKEHDYIQGHVDTIEKVVKEKGLEEGDGLWANIRAKQKRGGKPAHGNSQAHKDAVKAGKKINKESVNENFIPKVGTIDDFELKNLLLKNPKVYEILPDKEFTFLKKSDTDVIRHQSKRFNTIVTDGKFEFEIDLKLGKLIKPLSKARKEIVSYYSSNESVNEGDVTKKINRRGDKDGLLVKHNGEEYHIVYSGDFDMGTSVQPYGIVMPGDDTVSFLGKDKKAKQIWKQLKPKVDKFFKTNEQNTANESVNEATPDEEDEFHRNLDKLVHKTFGHSSDEEKINEASEPDIITQLRDVVENGYNTLKDPKTGKKMKVDTYSASAVTQVYDALKQQSNKDKFVSNGLVGMVNLAFKILNKHEIVEYDVETLEELNDFHQFMKEYKSDINEGEYQGRKVELGKIMQGDVKKFKVYVNNDKGNVVKVNFGQKGMVIKKDNPDARKSFRARMNCDEPGPRWKARYWSCRKW